MIDLGGKPAVVVLFEADCPTCHLALPYLNRLAARVGQRAAVIGVSQDSRESTDWLIERLPIEFPVRLDEGLALTRKLDPQAVPTTYLLDEAGVVQRTVTAFSKNELNALADDLSARVEMDPAVLISPFDGAPDTKPGCISRHLEPAIGEFYAGTPELFSVRGRRASRIELPDDVDPYDHCREAGFGDPLPVVPPTVERVDRMLAAVDRPPDEIVAHVPPNYAPATVEKIAANAVMAGCAPEMMRVLIPLVRAACDERFNLHGIQATTHFATPLVIVNGPIRGELGFASGSNVFSNVARANSTLGRALQLMLGNLGGAQPGEIDMSALGNPGKFSYVIAENEEVSPWEPLAVTQGIQVGRSALTLFGAEPPRGVSEHTARDAAGVLRAISRCAATVWSYGMCKMPEALIVVGPEHAATIARSGFSRQDAVDFLFENTLIPASHIELDGGEGSRMIKMYDTTTVGGERCYRKFAGPQSIRIVVAGGSAGKFSAVVGSWATGPRGSQMVTYPIE